MFRRPREETDVIKLFGYLPAWGCSDMSPFVSTTDAYLRMAELPFEVEILHQGDLTKTPKGKLPFIVDDDGTTVSDSVLIEHYLKKKYGDRLDGELGTEQRAASALMARGFGECWYWFAVQTRYRRDEDFAVYDPLWVEFLAWLPVEQRAEPVRLFREHLLGQFWHHGTGRNSEAEVERIAFAQLDAMADHIGDKKYMFPGDRPTSIDAVAYANLVHIMLTPFPSPIIQYANSKPVLRRYVDRIFDRYYPHRRAAREEAERMRAEHVKARKPYTEDSDRLLRQLFDPQKPKFKS
jgi:isoprene-epoxide---glutathione S-transferase